MFYRGQSYVSGPRIPIYFMRGMEGGQWDHDHHHHHDGHYPPPPGGGNDGNFFGTGALTSFIFGGIAGAVLANVFDQKQVNAQAIPYSAQPIPVATPVPYYQPYFSQPTQSQVVNQGQAMQQQYAPQTVQSQSYGTLIGEPNMTSSKQVIMKGQPMQIAQQSPNSGTFVPYSPTIQPMNSANASSVPVPMQPMNNAMPYYMFPIQTQPSLS